MKFSHEPLGRETHVKCTFRSLVGVIHGQNRVEMTERLASMAVLAMLPVVTDRYVSSGVSRSLKSYDWLRCTGVTWGYEITPRRPTSAF
jgi:hypothetical protein